MFKRLTSWFSVFGLSVFVSNVLNIAEQGKAFFVIYLLVLSILTYTEAYISIRSNFYFKWLYPQNLIIVLTVILCALIIGVIVLVLWGVTKILGVNLYTTVQVVTFFVCFLPVRSQRK